LSSAGVIRIAGLTRRFGPNVAVRPITTEIGPGGITGLLGPNGSGKSTLLRMLLGLVRPDAGTAEVDGIALAGDGLGIRRRTTYVAGELHVYGEAIPLGGADAAAAQHRGLGRRLLREARQRARADGYRDLAVISAVGTRPYYEANGFEQGRLYQHQDLS